MKENELKSDNMLIKNPFVVNTIAGVRLSPDKDPRCNKHKLTKNFTQCKLPSGNTMLHNRVDDKLNFVLGTNEEREYADGSKLDYYVSADTLNAKRTDEKRPHTTGVPYSFLQIDNERDGIEWYQENYPKIPEELLPIIARYHWGVPITKKGVKNERKKIMKKLKTNHLTSNNGKFVMDFD